MLGHFPSAAWPWCSDLEPCRLGRASFGNVTAVRSGVYTMGICWYFQGLLCPFDHVKHQCEPHKLAQILTETYSTEAKAQVSFTNATFSANERSPTVGESPPVWESAGSSTTAERRSTVERRTTSRISTARGRNTTTGRSGTTRRSIARVKSPTAKRKLGLPAPRTRMPSWHVSTRPFSSTTPVL